eukprot:gene15502-20921_t
MIVVALVLSLAGICVAISTCISIWLMTHHHQHFNQSEVQSKIIGILWMVPIYSIDSFLGLWFPYQALYINMLRDCYEAYVLYLFLSLMLSYLNCHEDDYDVIAYLETKPNIEWPYPFNYCCNQSIPKGRQFLRFCKFGTLQYCVIRPLTTIAATILEILGLYHENDLHLRYGYIYILIILNISVLYAFIVLATFYSALKVKLRPFEPVGKFLCIKFVIFFAFWQSVILSGLVKFGVITEFDGYNAEILSSSLQDFLICIEMVAVSIAHLYTFSYEPFVIDDT